MKNSLLFFNVLFSFIWGNAQWQTQNTNIPLESAGVQNISIVSNDIAWITHYDGSGGGGAVQYYSKTTDGGENWNGGEVSLGNGSLGIAMISAISDMDAWIIAYPTVSGNGGVFRTSDGGNTWTKQTTAAFSTSTSFPNVVTMNSSGVGFAQGDPANGYFELYTTTNFGENWVRVPQANIAAPLAGEYGYTGQIDKVGNNIWFTTNKGRIYKSNDSGLNWTAHQTPISDFGGTTNGDVSFTNANDGLMISSGGQIWNTNNGGETWNAMTPTGTMYYGDIAFVPGTDVVVSTSSANPGSAYSTDAGQTWTSIDVGVQHTAVEFNENGVGWSGGFVNSQGLGGIFKYVFENLSVTDLVPLTKLSVYPNPASSQLNLSSSSKIQSIQLMDVSGKVLRSLEVNAVSKYTLNVDSLSPGMYIIQIKTVDGVENRKFIKK